MLDLLPIGAFFVIILVLALVVGFFIASKDRGRSQLGIALAVGAIAGLLVGFSVVFWEHVRHAKSFGDAFEAIAANIGTELRYVDSIHWILGPTASCMLISWLSLAMYRRVFRPSDAIHGDKPPID